MLPPQTFAAIVAGVLAFAHLTQSFLPMPYAAVKAVDNAALAVLHSMHPPTPQACTATASGDC